MVVVDAVCSDKWVKIKLILLAGILQYVSVLCVNIYVGQQWLIQCAFFRKNAFYALL